MITSCPSLALLGPPRDRPIWASWTSALRAPCRHHHHHHHHLHHYSDHHHHHQIHHFNDHHHHHQHRRQNTITIVVTIGYQYLHKPNDFLLEVKFLEKIMAKRVLLMLMLSELPAPASLPLCLSAEQVPLNPTCPLFPSSFWPSQPARCKSAAGLKLHGNRAALLYSQSLGGSWVLKKGIMDLLKKTWKLLNCSSKERNH